MFGLFKKKTLAKDSINCPKCETKIKFQDVADEEKEKSDIVSWKASRVVVAAISVASTLLLCAGLLPSYIKFYEAKLENAKIEIEKLEKLKTKIKENESEITKIKELSKLQKIEILTMQGNNTFNSKNVFPVGFRCFDIGSDVSNINKMFPMTLIRWQDSWVEINLEDNLFASVIIRFKKQGNQKIAKAFYFYHKKVEEKSLFYLYDLLRKEFNNFKANKKKRNSILTIEINNLTGYNLTITDKTYKISKPDNMDQVYNATI